MARKLTLRHPAGDPWTIEAGEAATDANHLVIKRANTIRAKIDENGQLSGQRQTVSTKTAAYTVTAADSGTVFIANAADLVFTLPSTAAGLTYTFVTKTLSATTGLSISPAAADKIMGNGITSADDKDLINSAASDAEGDMVTIVGDGADGWYVTALRGTWARQA